MPTSTTASEWTFEDGFSIYGDLDDVPNDDSAISREAFHKRRRIKRGFSQGRGRRCGHGAAQNRMFGLSGRGIFRHAHGFERVDVQTGRKHQGLDNRLVIPMKRTVNTGGGIQRRQRLGRASELLLQGGVAILPRYRHLNGLQSTYRLRLRKFVSIHGQSDVCCDVGFAEASKPNRHCAKERISGRDWFFTRYGWDRSYGLRCCVAHAAWLSGNPFQFDSEIADTLPAALAIFLQAPSRLSTTRRYFDLRTTWSRLRPLSG